ncbi:hypothetical protein KSF73_07760 [Burkholderiaceae bacterium DAT-1]|nr:hypothetical protein [Burkholderiaceae bacterium DAT-1]
MQRMIRMGLAVCGLALAVGATAATISPQTLKQADGERQYLLVTPEHAPAGKRPLVILLHGHGGSAKQLLGQAKTHAPLSVWLNIADREGLVLMAPDGEVGPDGKQGWRDCRVDATGNPATNDIGLINALIDSGMATQQVDPQRVYVMGMSNGAIMSIRVATELGKRIAAIAAVSGSQAVDSGCGAASQPVSALFINGTADPIVPYAGGPIHLGNRHRGSVLPIESVAADWRKVDGLGEEVDTRTLPHLDEQDPTRAIVSRWGSDPSGLQVTLVKIEGGGHVEPSISQRVHRLYAAIVGKQNGDLESAEFAWSFFKDKRVYSGKSAR